MGFAQSLANFAAKTKENLQATREGVDDETFRSIVEGSEITGAPGQPVRTRKLHDSWSQDVSETETVTSSDSPYAPAVEENLNNAVYENHGPHSVKQTVVAFPRIVEEVVARVVG